MLARTVVIPLLSIAISAGLAGCASPPKEAVKHAEKAADSLTDLRNEVNNGKKQLDATLAALNKLVSQTSGNRRPAFETYMKELARTQVQADKAKARAKDLSERADAYIARWQLELTKVPNPEPRQLAEARRSKVRAGIVTIQTTAGAACDAYQPLLQGLLDIQTALSNDLTEAGFAAVTPAVAQATNHGGEMQDSLEALLREIDGLRGEVATK